MKRAFSLLLVSIILCLSACGTNSSISTPATTQEKTPSIYYDYPGNTGIEVGTAPESIPKSVYTQPASENGLAGSCYIVKGIVTEVDYMDEMPYFVVATSQGDVIIGNMAIFTATLDSAYDVEVDIETLNEYYPTPTVGESVRVFAEYQGWSDLMDLPIFMYGSTDYFYIALMQSSTLDETEPPETTEPPKQGTMQNPYPSGTYKIGTDLPAGEYVFFSTSSTKAYVCLSSDSNQDDIIENENFSGTFIITATDGQYLEANRCKFVTAVECTISINADGSFDEGMYRVGIDIPAGEYKLTATSDIKGYWCIYKNSNAPFRIVNNDNFENSAYVTVKNGQYLLLSRCTAEPV